MNSKVIAGLIIAFVFLGNAFAFAYCDCIVMMIINAIIGGFFAMSTKELYEQRR